MYAKVTLLFVVLVEGLSNRERAWPYNDTSACKTVKASEASWGCMSGANAVRLKFSCWGRGGMFQFNLTRYGTLPPFGERVTALASTLRPPGLLKILYNVRRKDMA